MGNVILGGRKREFSKGSVKTALLGTAAIYLAAGLVGGYVHSAHAQSTSARSAAANTIIFDIRPQELGSALTAFADRAELRLLFPSSLVAGKRSPGISGSLTREQALSRLLEGTSLNWRFTAANTVTILDPTRSNGAGNIDADGSLVLDTITVHGESAWGPVGGYVATQSAIGSKTDTPLVEIPRSISVVSRDEIRARGATTVPQALHYTAGVSSDIAGNDDRSAYLNVRGFTFPPLFRDGLRNIARDELVEPFGLERIEVLKGPASALYGQGSPGGLVNAATKRPPETPLHEIELQAGSYERIQGAFDIGGPVDEQGQFRYRLTGLGRNGDSSQAPHLDESRIFIAPAFTWQPTENTTLTLLGAYQKDKLGYDYVYVAPGGRPTRLFIGEPTFNTYESEQYYLGYLFEHRFNDVFQLRQNLRYTSLDIINRNLQFASLAPDGRTINRRIQDIDNHYDGITVDTHAQANFSLGPTDHTLLFGIDYSRIEADLKTRSGLGPTLDRLNPIYGQPVLLAPLAASSDQVQNQTGLYLQDQIKLDRWILTLNGRHDWSDSKTDNRLTSMTTSFKDTAFTGSAGLSYLFDSGFAPYVSYATSFEPQAGTDAVGNPFKPTEGVQYEAGVKYQPAGFNTLVTLSTYQLTRQNVLTPDPVNAGRQVQTGEVRIRGIELEGKTSPAVGFNVIASMAFQDAEITRSNAGDQGNRPPIVPVFMASVWGDYTFQNGPLGGLGFGIGVRHIGSTYADNSNTLENSSYTLVDAALFYDFEKAIPQAKGLRLSVNARNLFDKEYSVCIGGASNCYWGTGRTVMATLRYQW